MYVLFLISCITKYEILYIIHTTHIYAYMKLKKKCNNIWIRMECALEFYVEENFLSPISIYD